MGYRSPFNTNTGRDVFAGLNQGSDGRGSYMDQFKDFDPRNIMEGDAYKQMMRYGQHGSGGPATARGIMEPGMEYMRNALGQDSPLGAGRGDLVRSRGTGAVSNQLESMGQQVREASTRYGRAADPEAAAFSQQMVRNRAAGAYGNVEREAQETELNERAMNENFKAGMASALNAAGLNLGGLEVSDFNSRVNATGQALQTESFAQNTAAELLTRIMGFGTRGGGGGALPLSLEERGRLRQMQREQLFGATPQFQPFGSYGEWGGVASDRGAGGGGGGYTPRQMEVLGYLEGKDPSSWSSYDMDLISKYFG